MRFVIGVVLALSVGIGAYLGSAQVADSAKTPPRRVTLHLGDIAAVGHVQCQAWGGTSPRYPIRAATYLRCSQGPWSRAAERVNVGSGLDFEKKVGHGQCFLEDLGTPPQPHPTFYFHIYLACKKGPHATSYVSIKVLPSGINVEKKGKIAYRTGWDG